jgi:hypothetical protein
MPLEEVFIHAPLPCVSNLVTDAGQITETLEKPSLVDCIYSGNEVTSSSVSDPAS